jgi:type III restriction enzyme
MKLKFDPSLTYQQDAVHAVADVFDGQPLSQSTFEISSSLPNGAVLTQSGVGNNLLLADDDLLANVHLVQERNNIAKVDRLKGRDFSVEMETGTGKTYVYLRTIFELNKRYGFKKFIIVVPSVAIREGVLKSIDITREHFRALYDNIPFKEFVYDSKRLGSVRQFADSNHIQIMIINIQAFQKDVEDNDIDYDHLPEEEEKKLNVIYRYNDKMQGRPIEFIQGTNPIVIIDEPQSVDNTPKSRRAIKQLNPAVTLRYSATHRETYNLLYRLGPIDAYDLRLVKRIEVASIRADDDFNNAYVKLLKTDNRHGIKAQVEFFKDAPSGPKRHKAWVKQGDDLYQLSGEFFPYRSGFVVQNIDSTPGLESIEFNQGRFLELEEETGGNAEDVMRVMVRETIEQHLKKERALKGCGIKVLSLFFIDKVSNYRVYQEDGTVALGKLGQWFEEEYRSLVAKPQYRDLLPFSVEQLHNGYFSQDKKGQAKDTKGNTQADEDTYALIMRDKERLLDPQEPLRFIFSHTALREGWDNPNVFQICTLREVGTEMERRQQIGRGLRLPVNNQGEQVHDEHLNRLTVIASEAYEDFAQALQTEYEQDYGIKFGRIERHAFAKLVERTSEGTEKPVGQERSEAIWNALQEAGYIDAQGDIQDTFDPSNVLFRMTLPEDFADLQTGVVDEMRRYLFKNRVVNARQKEQLTFNKRVQLREDFQELWGRIQHKTRYRVHFETPELIQRAVSRIKSMEQIQPLSISMRRAELEFEKAGINTDRELEHKTTQREAPLFLPDIITFLQKETELTRHTLIQILSQSGRLAEFPKNPQQFMALAAREISRAMHELMLDGIKYERINECWDMKRIEKDAEKGMLRYLNNLYQVRHKEKSLFDYIEFDSEVEKRFAEDLDNNERVKLFVKLPGWFKIDTPIGPYNPDWALVTSVAS